jgi:uncharacterized membrane protein
VCVFCLFCVSVLFVKCVVFVLCVCVMYVRARACDKKYVSHFSFNEHEKYICLLITTDQSSRIV